VHSTSIAALGNIPSNFFVVLVVTGTTEKENQKGRPANPVTY